jgi:ribonuclease HI
MFVSQTKYCLRYKQYFPVISRVGSTLTQNQTFVAEQILSFFASALRVFLNRQILEYHFRIGSSGASNFFQGPLHLWGATRYGRDLEMKMSTWPSAIVIYTDGACRGNPGPASIGIYITSRAGEVIAEHGETLGIQTNNYAEYMGVLRALEMARDHQVQTVELRSDSQLMVRQMQGLYKVKSPQLLPLFTKCRELAKSFSAIRFEHVRREFNVEADRLANEALDR